jgi:hypothetical protein
VLTADRAAALARVGLGLAGLLNAAEGWGVLTRIADGRIAMPVADAAPPVQTWSVGVLTTVAVLASLALVVGWRTRAAALVLAGADLVTLLWDQQTYSSHRLLSTILLVLLAFAGSDRTWAVQRSEAEASPWPRLLMMSQLSVCYLFAALSKLNVTFLSGAPLHAWLRWDLPVLLTFAMAIGAVLTELTIAICLWSRRFRLLAVALGVLLHVSIVVGLADQTWPLTAFALTCVPLYGLFLTQASGRYTPRHAASSVIRRPRPGTPAEALSIEA